MISFVAPKDKVIQIPKVDGFASIHNLLRKDMPLRRDNKHELFMFMSISLRLNFEITPFVGYSTMPHGLFYVTKNIALEGSNFIFIPRDLIACLYYYFLFV